MTRPLVGIRPPPPRVPEAEQLLSAAEDIAREAGRLVMGLSAGRREESKGHVGNLVTTADMASENLIVGRLAAAFPGHAIVAEEGPGLAGAGVTWIVDPLDGTNNFAHGYPMYAVSLAALVGGAVLVGVTFDPVRDEMFAAAAGRGATLNGARIHVSERARLEEALVVTGFPYDKASNPDNNLLEVAAVVPKVRGLRRSGSACLDLAYVAAGRADAYWERGTQPWDVAAGLLLVAESGGVVTDYDGARARVDAGRLAASNGRVHAELLQVLEWARRDLSG